MMKAVVLEHKNRISIKEISDPEPADGHVIAMVKAVGVCGSDIHYYKEGGIGKTEISADFVPGHEFSVTLLEDIPEFNLSEGQHVAIDPAKPCDHCEWCKRGHENLCPNVEFIGAPPYTGAMAELVSIKKKQIHPVPDSFSASTSVLLETLGVALHAVDLSKVRLHQTIGILGCGPVGLCLLQLFRNMGAKMICVVDPLQYRLAVAMDFGADHSFSDLSSLSQLTNGYGLDVVVEATNSPHGFKDSVSAVKIGGKVIIVGIPDGDHYSVVASEARRKGLTIKFSRRMGNVFERAIGLVDKGLVKLERIASHHFDLDQCDQAFKNNAEYKDNVLKSIIYPN
jgi:L-iditol 2-dehydrogenase